MEPKPATPGGPPIWIGGRAEAALKRAALHGDGWMPYVLTPKRIADGLEFIAREANRAGRKIESFGTSFHAFVTLGKSYEVALEVAGEQLSKRYAMDFRNAAQRYCALGTPAEIVASIRRFHAAGVRHVILDFVGPYEERERQIERFAAEALPLLADLRRG